MHRLSLDHLQVFRGWLCSSSLPPTAGSGSPCEWQGPPKRRLRFEAGEIQRTVSISWWQHCLGVILTGFRGSLYQLCYFKPVLCHCLGQLSVDKSTQLHCSVIMQSSWQSSWALAGEVTCKKVHLKWAFALPTVCKQTAGQGELRRGHHISLKPLGLGWKCLVQ